MSPIPLADDNARRRIRDELDRNFIVEAAAGTGKTTALVDRIVSVLKSGASIRNIVAVTFTDPASGELKLRLRKRIEDERQQPDAPEQVRQRLEESLKQLEEARIGTIHSFCSDLLRERPVEAGIDPLFDVTGEETGRALFDRAFDRWFEAQLADPGEGVRRILRRRPGEDGPRSLLRNAAWELASRRDFPAQWQRVDGFERTAAIDRLLKEMASLADWADAGDPGDYFAKSLIEIKKFVDDVRRTESIIGYRDYDELEPRIADLTRSRNRFWNWTGFRRSQAGFPKDELMRRRDELKLAIDAFRDEAGADLAPLLRDEIWPVVEAYEHLKQRAGCLDFLDLLLSARDLIRGNKSVRNDYQSRFAHIFVDEFQDTDPLQAEILLLLSSGDPDETDWRRVKPIAGKLFIVGDPKQSIYRFRRADVMLYEQVKRQVLQSGGELLELNVSFRSAPEIQQAVNSAFALSMNGSSETQARYVPLAPHRESTVRQPAIVALPVPEPYGDYGKVVEWRIEESLPEVIASFIAWITHPASGWTVTERERPHERIPVAPHHVCLLFRRFRSFNTDVTRAYVRAMEKRQIPHLLVGGSSFFEREEIEAILNALSAIERLDDELSLYATLRGPFFALNDAQLLAYKHKFHGWGPPPSNSEELPPQLQEVADAVAVLRSLRRGRNHRPVSDTISRLLNATRAHAGLAIWSSGQQALANIARLTDIARRAERTGTTSFRAFVDYLRDQRERGEASDAPIIEEGAEGVRLMTVHRAKGLEFPVVILADLTAKETPANPSRWVNPETGLCAFKLAGCLPAELQNHRDDEMRLEQEEAARILYVAATRARDLLIVPALADERHDGGWLQALHPAIYPTAEKARSPLSTSVDGCLRFGTDSVPGRPEKVKRPETSVSPGLHKPESGEHSVVWWDPSTLELEVEDTIDRSKQAFTNSLLTPDKGKGSREGTRLHNEWMEKRRRVRQAAQTPSISVFTATELSQLPRKPPGTVRGVQIEKTGITRRREHGKRFGTLVHAVMSLVALDGNEDAVRRVANQQGRLFGATESEIASAIDTVKLALSHPLIVKAAAARKTGHCRRESPVSMMLEDETLVEGIVDLAFLAEEAGRAEWIVIDFKTDISFESKRPEHQTMLEEYKTQVCLYARAIESATGQPARGVLLGL